MSESNLRRIEKGHAKIRNVPIAVTPEGFWCCPAQVVFQKAFKNQNSQNKPNPSENNQNKSNSSEISSVHNTSVTPPERKYQPSPSKSRIIGSDDQKSLVPDITSKQNAENPPRKISVGFGQPETSDLKVILYGKEGILVKMSVHKDILLEHSSFFMEKLAEQSAVSCIEVEGCDDVEIYVDTIGLMYCKELKIELFKQSVKRVLRIMKVAETLGFRSCIMSCLDYLEVAPWAWEEEEKVLSSIRRLKIDSGLISPILKRVSPSASKPPNDTLLHVLELVLKSNEERGRREMKSMVLKLLKENSFAVSGSTDICLSTLYNSCRSCLNSLLSSFKQATEPEFSDKSFDSKDKILKHIALEADNLLWLVEILVDRRVADEFAQMWADQNEVARLHPKLPIMHRHIVSCISARIFVGIGKGEILPSKDIRQLLLNVWLQPLMDDYSWLQHSCRSFDSKVAEEGIGRTISTLPLDDQQSILLSWLGSFLKVGDSCPNLQRAFEVWWRRTFVRPCLEQKGAEMRVDTD